ncbi:unnamed protein product, partial [Phaeothamnion confervicola]
HTDAAQARALFEQALEKRSRLGKEAALLLESELGLLKLQQHRQGGDSSDSKGAEEVKEFLPRGKTTLEDLQGADTAVYSAYYKLSSEYFKMAGPPEAFYKAALMRLAYTPLESLPRNDQLQLATDISLAAVTGDGVFNFGEVLATPALGVLEGTENAWLGELLRLFNRGDIDGFGLLAAEHSAAMAAQPALTARAEFVKEKIALLALMNMVFERPSHERTISFADIAERTRLPVEQVEWLVMRAMSLSLVRGVMDEVEQELHVTWVQPRVLDKEQLGHLVERLDAWKDNVANAHAYIEEQTPELFG